MTHALPEVSEAQVAALLRTRRFVILEGPPGTGKTRLARRLLRDAYANRGTTIQFHPSVTYEDFVGGLAPDVSNGDSALRFRPAAGHLLRACEEARRTPDQDFLLHIDEINRADLAKTLGEAIYLFEVGEPDREIELAHDFGPGIGRRLGLPPNLHVLGTMNSADRNIAILDLAIRRRFGFVHVPPHKSALNKAPEVCQEKFDELLELFLNYATDDVFDLMPGQGYFLPKNGDGRSFLRTGVAPLLRDYLRTGLLAGFEGEIEAYLDSLEAGEV